MEYERQSAELDRRILAVIEVWHRGDIVSDNDLELLFIDTARYQACYNTPYRSYLEYLRIDIDAITDLRMIPAVPASAFKDAELTTGDAATVEAIFRTSGTTQSMRGRHFIESTNLYRASSLAIFDRLVLAPRNLLGVPSQRLRFISLVPNTEERSDSSLGFMVDHFIAYRGDGRDARLLRGDRFDLSELRACVQRARADGVTLCLFTTALAALQVLVALDGAAMPLPGDSIIIETGGFKGAVHTVSRTELYARLADAFALERSSIIAEFGMTELTSQYYDLTSSCVREPRVKVGPPWLRTTLVDAAGNEVPAGQVGALRHFDLANRSSVLAIDTEDLGIYQGGGFVLLGRQPDAELRGCSLDAEHLRVMGSRM